MKGGTRFCFSVAGDPHSVHNVQGLAKYQPFSNSAGVGHTACKYIPRPRIWQPHTLAKSLANQSPSSRFSHNHEARYHVAPARG